MAQWVRVEAAALPKHRKTERLMSALGLSRIEATGALVSLWGRALDEAPDGCLDGWTAEDVARAMELGGRKAGVVLKSMLEAGFVDDRSGVLVLHDWMQYQGNFREAKRKAEWRASRSRDETPPSPEVPGPSRDDSGLSRDSRAGADVTDVTDVGSSASRSPTPVLSQEPSGGNLTLSGRAKNRAPFVRPTLDEVTAYCAERQALDKPRIDPALFLDHYESNGWRVGKNSMKDWRAAVRTWEANGFSGNGKGPGGASRGRKIMEFGRKLKAEEVHHEQG